MLCLAARRRGVDALCLQEQVNLESVQLGKEADEVLQRAAQAVDRPGHDDIKLTLLLLIGGRLVDGRNPEI